MTGFLLALFLWAAPHAAPVHHVAHCDYWRARSSVQPCVTAATR